MTWKLIDKPKTVKVTKKLAQMFSDMEAAPHDRPLSERRLIVYRKVLAEGGFRPVSWASAICKETGGVYRVNGKHTSTMLAAMNPVPEFYAILEEYECDTLEDVARLYATFDSNIQSRTARDIYLSFASTVPELSEVPARYIVLAVGAMSFDPASSGVSVSSRSQAADRAETLLECPEFVRWLSTILGGAEGKGVDGRVRSQHLQRQAVAAAMYATWKKVVDDSFKFWSAVRDETGTKPSDPDRKLARYLSTITVGTGNRAGVRAVKIAGVKEIYVKCLHAWNAWRRGENTDLKFYPEKDVPSVK